MHKPMLQRTVSLMLAMCVLLAAVLVVLPGAATAVGEKGIYKPQVDGEVLYWGSDQISAKNQTLRFTGHLNSPSDNYNKSQFYISLRAKSMVQPWEGPDGGYWIMIDNGSVLVRYNNNTLFNTGDDSFAAEPGFSDTRWAIQTLLDAAGGQKAFYTADHAFEFSAIDEEGGVRLTAKIDGTVILNWLDTSSTVANAGGFSIRTEDVYEWYASDLVFVGEGVTMDMLTDEHIGKLSTNTTYFGGYANAAVPEAEGKPVLLYKPQVNGEILYWGSNQVSAKNQTLRFTGHLNSPSDNYNKTQLIISLRAKSMVQSWEGPDGGYWIMIDNGSVLVRYNNNTLFNTGDDSFAAEPGFSDTRCAIQTLLDAAGGQKAFYTADHTFEFSAIDEEGGVRLTAKIDGTVILNWLDTSSTVTNAGGFSIRTEDVYELYATDLVFIGDDGAEMDMLTKSHVDKLSTNTTSFGGYAKASDEGETPTDPDEGDTPTTPTDPDEGDTPTTPTDPDAGDTPTTPTDPDEGDTPTTPTDPDEGGESPKPEKPILLYKPQVNGEVLYWGSNQVSAKNQTIRFTGHLNSPSDNYNKAQFYISLRAKSMAQPWEGPDGGYWIMIDNGSVLVRYNNNTLFNTGDDSFAAEPGFSDTRWAIQTLLDAAGGQKAFYTADHTFEFSAIDEESGVRLTAKIDGTVILNWLDTSSTVTNAGGFSIRTEDVYELYATDLVFIGDDGAEMDMLTKSHVDKLSTNTTSFGGYAKASDEGETPTDPDEGDTPTTPTDPDEGGESPKPEKPILLYKPQVNGEVLYWGSDRVNAKNQTLRFSGYLNSPSDNYNKAQFYISLRAKSMAQPWEGPDGGYWIMIDNGNVWVKFNNTTIFNTADDNFAGEPGYSETRWTLQSLLDGAGGQKAFYTKKHDFEFSAIDEEGGVRLIAKIDGVVILNWLDTNKTVPGAGGFSVRTEDVYELYATDLVFIGDDGAEMDMLTKNHVDKLSTNTTNFGGYAKASDEDGNSPTGDAVSVIAALLFVSGAALVVLKKKA